MKHREFKYRICAALDVEALAKHLDEWYKGEGYFMIIDQGPYEEQDGYYKFSVACWVPEKRLKKNA